MRLRRLLVAVAVLLLVVLLGAVGFALHLRGSGLPVRSGEVSLSGLSKPVQVRWDRWGVPAVTGSSLPDVIAAQGYLHADDRFTQMELGRRAAAGRLSELFGRRTLALDRRARRLRFAATAGDLWRWAGPESRALLEAYAAGVNAWIAEHRDDLPPTLRLLGVDPEPWRPEDSLGFVLLMANDLSFWQGRPEEARFRWLRALGVERTRDLLGGPPLDVPAAIEALAKEPSTAGAGRGAGGAGPGAPEGSPGSNDWALGGSRTASGHPLLANDPHLALRLPGTWYQMLLRSPGYEVMGMTLPGVPGVVLGRNRDLAWAFTNTMLDDHDLFFERLDASGERVRRGEAWVPVTVHRESIAVRGGDPVEMRVAETDRGPLLPADPAAGLPARSLAWTLYLRSDPLAAFLALAKSHTVEEALGGIGSYVGPAQNLLLADREGSLALTVLGRVPARRRGDGRLPAPGWDPSYGWDGLRPQESNPRTVRPADDLLVTANNDILPQDYPLPFSADFDTPHRARRIRELLTAKEGWRPAGMAGVQTDVVSDYAKEVVGLLGKDRYDGDAGRAMAVLAGWDGTMRGGPAALFALVELELHKAIFGDEARRYRIPPPGSRERLLRLLSGTMDAAWFDDVTTPAVEGRHETVTAALGAAFREGERRWGSEVAAWRYGEIHRLVLRHPLGALPIAGGWFDRGPFPMPGSSTTVAAFGGRWRDGRQWVTYGPSMRWVTPLDDPDGTLAVVPGGQSGHPGDPHYDDQLPLYLAGQMHAVAWSDAAIDRATVARLTLHP